MKIDPSTSIPVELGLNLTQAVKWKGNHFIFCKGLLYAGPKFYAGLITLIYLSSYSFIFVNYILYRWTLNQLNGFWVTEFILYFFTAVFCLACIFTNPGALPIHNIFPNQIHHIHCVSNCVLSIYRMKKA